MQFVTSLFATTPVIQLVLAGLAGLLLICMLAGIATSSVRQREMLEHIHAISESLDEQSRAIEKIRRSLGDVMEVVISIETASRQHVKTEQGTGALEAAIPGESVLALRQDLESLKAEIAADLSSAALGDSRGL